MGSRHLIAVKQVGNRIDATAALGIGTQAARNRPVGEVVGKIGAVVSNLEDNLGVVLCMEEVAIIGRQGIDAHRLQRLIRIDTLLEIAIGFLAGDACFQTAEYETFGSTLVIVVGDSTRIEGGTAFERKCATHRGTRGGACGSEVQVSGNRIEFAENEIIDFVLFVTRFGKRFGIGGIFLYLGEQRHAAHTRNQYKIGVGTHITRLGKEIAPVVSGDIGSDHGLQATDMLVQIADERIVVVLAIVCILVADVRPIGGVVDCLVPRTEVVGLVVLRKRLLVAQTAVEVGGHAVDSSHRRIGLLLAQRGGVGGREPVVASRKRHRKSREDNISCFHCCSLFHCALIRIQG